MKICKKCNAQTQNDNAEFCSLCGEEFKNNSAQNTPETESVILRTPKTEKHGKGYLATILGVICCIFLAISMLEFSANLSMSIVSFKLGDGFFESFVTEISLFLEQVFYDQSGLTELFNEFGVMMDFVLESILGFSDAICETLRAEFVVRTIFSLINSVVIFLVAFVLFGGNKKNLKAPSVSVIISGIGTLLLGGMFLLSCVVLKEFFYYVDTLCQVMGLAFVLSGVLEILLGSVFCTLSSHKKYKNN